MYFALWIYIWEGLGQIFRYPSLPWMCYVNKKSGRSVSIEGRCVQSRAISFHLTGRLCFRGSKFLQTWNMFSTPAAENLHLLSSFPCVNTCKVYVKIYMHTFLSAHCIYLFIFPLLHSYLHTQTQMQKCSKTYSHAHRRPLTALWSCSGIISSVRWRDTHVFLRFFLHWLTSHTFRVDIMLSGEKSDWLGEGQVLHFGHPDNKTPLTPWSSVFGKYLV